MFHAQIMNKDLKDSHLMQDELWEELGIGDQDFFKYILALAHLECE